MLSMMSLSLAVVAAAVLVQIASTIVWMFAPHHKSDYARLPDEDSARSALAPQNLQPGQYSMPHCASMEQMKDPETVARMESGPVAFITVLPKGMPPMGKNILLTFVFYLAVGALIAYLARLALPAGAAFWETFRMVSATAWLAYGFAVVPDAIWYGRPWRNVAKLLFDALVYALLTAGAFASLWPSA
ncbi:MAG: hypothetical protein ACR2RL_18530 [Gammaproteobacteria bacterium]